MKWASHPPYQSSGVDWVGDIPAEWTIARLKTLARLGDEKVEAEDDEPTPYIGLEHVEPWTGRLLPLDPRFAPSGVCNRVRASDIMFGKLRPYLAKATIAKFDSLSSTEFLLLRDASADVRFLLYVVLAEGFIRLVDMSTFGAKMPRASWDFIGSCRLPVPPRREQSAIVSFLDRETAKLDELITKKRTLIERLHEERASLITRTVTRGLSPEAAAAAGLAASSAMKATGIEWIPEVPAHWTVKRLKYVAADVTVGVVVMPSQYYADDGVPALRSLNVHEMTLSADNLVYFDEVSNKILAKSMLRKDDLVIVRTGKPGTAAVVDPRFDGANCIDLILVRKSPRFSSRFLGYVLNSGAAKAQYGAGAEGAIQQHFNVETADNLIVPLPPLSEQKAVEAFLDEKVGKIETLIDKVEAALDRLQEFRAALITAAVTGKIDVRGATL